jgi:hypothetical protein
MNPERRFQASPEDASDVLKTTDEIIRKFGPRLAGSDACLKASGQIKNRFEKTCDRVLENRYDPYHPEFYFTPGEGFENRRIICSVLHPAL